MIDAAKPSQHRLVPMSKFGAWTEGARKTRERLILSLRNRYKTLRYQGFGALLWDVAGVGLSPLGSAKLITLCKRDLTQPIPEIAAKMEAKVIEGSEADAEELAAQIAADFHIGKVHLPTMHEKIRLRFRVGQRCYIVRLDGRIAHYTWIGFQQCPSVMDRFIAMEEDEAYLAWGYTVEKWRGMGFYPAVGSQVLRNLQQGGYKRIYAIVQTDNTSSRKGLRKAGWQECGSLLCFQPRGNRPAWIWQSRGRGEAGRFLVHPTRDLREKFGGRAKELP